MNLQNIKYKFYWKIDNKVVYFRTILNKYFLLEELLKDVYGLRVCKLNYERDADLQKWCDVINNSYSDCEFDKASAYEYLTNHLYLENTETFLFCRGNDAIGTISVGRYKANVDCSSLFRIAVLKKEQGCHYGYAVVLYALSYLQSIGFRSCEDLVSSKRTASINLHMNLGFEPLFDISKAVYTKNQKNINVIQKLRLKRHLKQAHNKYLDRIANLYQK